MPLVVPGLGDGLAAVECAIQRLPSCLPVAQSTAILAEKIQHLSSHLPSNPLNALYLLVNSERHVWPFDAVTLCLLISLTVSLLRCQAVSWPVLKLLYRSVVLVKCGSGNLQQLKVSFFPSCVHGSKNRALLPRQCYHCPLCSLKVLFWAQENE